MGPELVKDLLEGGFRVLFIFKCVVGHLREENLWKLLDLS